MRAAAVIPFCLAAIAAAPVCGAQDRSRAIDASRSTITIHVGKAGLFSVAGHEHWVNAPISEGVLSDSDNPKVEFTVLAAGLQVKPDPKVDAKTQTEIQKNMQEMTLESVRYPEIAYRSSRVEKQPGGQWKVEGFLKLHGMTRPVTAMVTKTGETYAGSVTIKQTDFGIKPVSAAGGAVKVKNELEIEFRIFTRPE